MEIRSNDSQTVLSLTVSDELDVKMDKLDLFITVTEDGLDYNSAMANGTKKNKEILDMFSNLPDSSIKVKSVTVSPIIDNVEEITKSISFSASRERRIVKKVTGHTYCSVIVLTFDADSKDVVNAYTKLITSGLVDNVSPSHYLENEESSKDLLLIRLVEKAKKQADIIASGLGYKVDRVFNIDKSVNKVSVNYSTVNSYCDDADFGCFDDNGGFEDFVSASATSMFNPDNIETKTFRNELNISFILEKNKG